MVPPADSPELSQARAALQAIAGEEIQLGRARDEIATNIARFEGELGAASVRDKEIEVDIATGNQIADYIAATEASQSQRQTLAALEQQKAERVRAAGEVWARHKSIEAGIAVLEEELKARTEEIAQTDAALAAERKAEPVLFGKDEWRARVAALEGQIESLRAAYGQRQGVLNGLKIDLSSVSVQVQTEQQQALLVDRQIAECRATLEAILKSVRDLAGQLGAQRPARPVPLAEAREALAQLQQARVENAQRIERLKAEVRRQKEETVRVLTRMKQIGVERQQLTAMVQSAEVAVSKGREEALLHMAAQRRAAVERHVAEVLGTLEKSLTMVGPVFVDPARKVMLDATEPRPEASAAVLEAADKVTPVVEKLGRELDAELLAQDAALGQIQREFCDVAATACRAAWS
jgi:chromosome segregation ATPase